MAASGYSPISLYYSTTASATPTNTNLVNGELALNITDGKLFYKDNAGTVQTLATKAATSGSFSTTTISTSETLSYGTANGVAYLNGSKVVTTGSALTFDGTNLSTTGRVIVSGGAGISDVSLGTYSGGAWLNTPSGSTAYLAVGGSNAFRWDASSLVSYIGGSEQMRLTSTGLGIGTSSPISKLHVFKSSGNHLQLQCDNTGTVAIDMGGTTTPAKGGISFSDNADALFFRTGSTERARINSSGNLGVGTTTPLAKLDVNGTSLLRNTQYTYQPTPTSLTGAQTLTAAQLLTGILINTAGTGNWTMPTGTAIETGAFANLPVDSAIRFVVIVTGGGGPTIATNTGVTLVGVMTVSSSSSATFILRKTATNTYTLYRA